MLAGHIQTSAHVLLGVLVYVAWRAGSRRARGEWGGLSWSSAMGWVSGIALGLAMGAITIVPLGAYLTRSPVWSDRSRERPGVLEITRPRLLDTACTVFPYLYGSQRAGHPNLARALGVHNLNESAGGYCGLTAALWLAPVAWATRGSRARVGFLAGLGGWGFLAAFGFAPVVNLMRALPVLDVMDHRRLTLWVAFAIALLGGHGIDALAGAGPGWRWRWWSSLCLAGSLGLLTFAAVLPGLEDWLDRRATAHYAAAARDTEGADTEAYGERARARVRATLDFMPRLLVFEGLGLAGMVALAHAWRRGLNVDWVRGAILTGTLGELLAFGMGLNPAIDPAADRPITPVVEELRRLTSGGGRILGLGQEWLPNVAMRYGLADVRNYDSVELARSIEWFSPLYEPGSSARTSRRTVTWAGVARALDRLRAAGARAIVAATPPPDSLALEARKIGRAWVAALDGMPLVSRVSDGASVSVRGGAGRIDVPLRLSRADRVRIAVTWDPGWRAEIDGVEVPVPPYDGPFMAVDVPEGAHEVRLRYDPPEVRAGVSVSLLGLTVSVLLAVPPWGRRGLGVFSASGLGRPSAVALESNDRKSSGSHRPGRHEG